MWTTSQLCTLVVVCYIVYFLQKELFTPTSCKGGVLAALCIVPLHSNPAFALWARISTFASEGTEYQTLTVRTQIRVAYRVGPLSQNPEPSPAEKGTYTLLRAGLANL